MMLWSLMLRDYEPVSWSFDFEVNKQQELKGQTFARDLSKFERNVNIYLKQFCFSKYHIFHSPTVIFSSRFPDSSPTDISSGDTSPTDISPTDTTPMDTSPTYVSPTRHFPDDHFPDGHFPDGHFPEGHFPDQTHRWRRLPWPDKFFLSLIRL